MRDYSSAFQTYQALKNVTTNERINAHKYEYLKDGNGAFSNPFDQGYSINMKEYFHFREPLVIPKDPTYTSSFAIV